MHSVELGHTAFIDEDTLAAAQALLRDVFADLDESDWEHSLGGIHAYVRENDQLVAHGSVVQRRLVFDGRAWRVGYVEAVAVRETHRRRGYGSRVMAALEEVIGRAYDFGALGATDQAIDFYAARGWQRWRGRLLSLTPKGVERTPEDEGAVFVFDGAVRLTQLDADLMCDWRDGDVW